MPGAFCTPGYVGQLYETGSAPWHTRFGTIKCVGGWGRTPLRKLHNLAHSGRDCPDAKKPARGLPWSMAPRHESRTGSNADLCRRFRPSPLPYGIARRLPGVLRRDCLLLLDVEPLPRAASYARGKSVPHHAATIFPLHPGIQSTASARWSLVSRSVQVGRHRRHGATSPGIALYSSKSRRGWRRVRTGPMAMVECGCLHGGH